MLDGFSLALAVELVLSLATQGLYGNERASNESTEKVSPLLPAGQERLDHPASGCRLAQPQQDVCLNLVTRRVRAAERIYPPPPPHPLGGYLCLPASVPECSKLSLFSPFGVGFTAAVLLSLDLCAPVGCCPAPDACPAGWLSGSFVSAAKRTEDENAIMVASDTVAQRRKKTLFINLTSKLIVTAQR